MKQLLAILALSWACIYLATYGEEPLMALAVFVIGGWGMGGAE